MFARATGSTVFLVGGGINPAGSFRIKWQCLPLQSVVLCKI